MLLQNYSGSVNARPSGSKGCSPGFSTATRSLSIGSSTSPTTKYAFRSVWAWTSLPDPTGPPAKNSAALHALGAQGINSPSATGVGEILAVFVQQIGLGHLEPHLAEEWHSLDEIGR